jgi:hypothetical protein
MTEPIDQPDPIVPSADPSVDAQPNPRFPLLSREMHYPNAYTWLLLLSSMDIMLTWVILLFGGSEVNPIARWIIDHFNLTGMIIYKFALIIFFITICEIVGTLRHSTGWLLSRVSVMIASIPVFWAMYLLARHNMG